MGDSRGGARLTTALDGGCRVNPASLLATVGTSNARYVSRVREATERGRARWLAVAVGDFHTAARLPDSLDDDQQSCRGPGAIATRDCARWRGRARVIACVLDAMAPGPRR